MQTSKKITFKTAFVHSLPVMAGYIFMGMGFGVLLKNIGYNSLWALLMSVTIIGGSMQYAAVEMLASASSLLHTLVMTVMINARYFFYGLSMLDKYKDIKKGKPYLIHTLTDETFSLVSSFDEIKHPKISRIGYYFILSALNHSYWIIGCVSGALLGEFTSFNLEGVEFAMTALFVAIFVEQWLENKDHFPALFGVIISLICLFIFKAQRFVIPSMLILTALLMSKKSKEALDNE